MSSVNHDLIEKTYQTKYGKIYYYLSNFSSDKPVVVFLHGLTANHTQECEIIKRLEEAGYRCLLPDMRGHGKSDKRKKKKLYKLDSFADDIFQILKEEKIDQIILIGYSLGGLVSLQFAITYPEYISRLVLIGTNFVSPFKYWRATFLIPVFQAILSLFSLLFVWQRRKEYDYFKSDESLTYWSSTILGFKTMPISVDLWILRSIISINFEPSLHKIKSPTLIIRSESDPFVSERETRDMSKKIVRSEVVFTNHNSHFIDIQTQDEIAENILNFLKKYENCNF